MRPLLIIGNSENRRVTAFAGEAAARGVEVHLLDWLELIAEPQRLLDRPEPELWLRIDSWGENVAVERALLRRGVEHIAGATGPSRLSPAEIDAATAEHGRIAAPRQLHLGVLAVLADLENALSARPGWRVAQPISAIRTLFDKRATHELGARLGVRMPALLPESATAQQLFETMKHEGVTRAFVKLTSGSSASCLALVELGAAGPSVMTSMELGAGCFYNSLKVRRYSRPEQIERVLGFLLAEGSVVERAIDKLPLSGRYADMRWLFVRGAGSFAVVRTSAVPITNLHLGGQRGDLEQYRRKLPEGSWREAEQLGQRLASALGTWHLGADIAFERDSRQPYLLEGNAFGDLLPGVERDGVSIYGWEIESLTRTLDASAPER